MSKLERGEEEEDYFDGDSALREQFSFKKPIVLDLDEVVKDADSLSKDPVELFEFLSTGAKPKANS